MLICDFFNFFIIFLKKKNFTTCQVSGVTHDTISTT